MHQLWLGSTAVARCGAGQAGGLSLVLEPGQRQLHASIVAWINGSRSPAICSVFVLLFVQLFVQSDIDILEFV